MGKPILFSSPMVTAILDGRKTMTRRVAHGALWLAPDGNLKFVDKRGIRPPLDACPYGKPGDLLWVRETFAVYTIGDDEIVVYRADSYPDGDGAKWKPSIFMPRKYSRITLRVTSVRVERLQDISEKDICAELGCARQWPGPGIEPYRRNLRSAFCGLWDSINGKRASWDSDPWVWVVEFTRHGEV